MQKEKHTTLKVILGSILVLIGFNFYLNHFYTEFDDRTIAEQPVKAVQTVTPNTNTKAFRTGLMYYFEKILNDNGYEFNWDDIAKESEELFYE